MSCLLIVYQLMIIRHYNHEIVIGYFLVLGNELKLFHNGS